MRISGTEPSSVILSQTKKFQKLKMMPKVPKQAEIGAELWKLLPREMSCQHFREIFPQPK